MVHLLIDIDVTLHSALKHRAIDQKITLKDLVIRLLEDGVQAGPLRDRRQPVPVRSVTDPRYGSFVGVGE